MKKARLVKIVFLTSIVTTLSVSTVYGASNIKKGELKQLNLRDVYKNAKSNDLYVGLNTNVDDIKNMSFYKTELSSNEGAVNPYADIKKRIEFTQLNRPVKGDLVAVIETSEGVIKVKFLPEAAPKAVKNFVEHSLDGYYDGLTFHRVIDDFVVQGGDPLGTGRGGESVWGKPFANEINAFARHYSGALAMANSGGTATNGSQFYFVDDTKISQEAFYDLAYFYEFQENEFEGGKVKDYFPAEVILPYEVVGGTPYLDLGYTVFGQTYQGLDVIEKISQTKTDENDKPLTPVIIKKITIGIVE